ncbi:hypothetical protein BDN70DRAFT_991247 [Pholiota conissans]|uniref:Uncharacterized protein n=1 Tax=Pholiota conissans TaxID=109636 RepID=A0A9P5Z652_9AGAR|nr:hypothetical protein BDN70DRAFT_991247 [Pholiota conissans]
MTSSIATAIASHDKAAVVETIKANPTWETINELGDTFVELAKEKPYESQRLATILAELKNDPDVPLIKSLDSNRQLVEEPYSQAVNAIVLDLLKWVFSDEPPAIEPTNPYLAAALISGACVRTGLCNSSVQSGEITAGLRFEGTKWQELIPNELAEVCAIHAVLHLLAGGSRIYREEQIGYRQNEVLPALKAIAEQNVIVNPEGKQLLQAAIAEAETGFERDIPLADIWKILFP